jgi:hypothetical protein
MMMTTAACGDIGRRKEKRSTSEPQVIEEPIKDIDPVPVPDPIPIPVPDPLPPVVVPVPPVVTPPIPTDDGRSAFFTNAKGRWISSCRKANNGSLKHGIKITETNWKVFTYAYPAQDNLNCSGDATPADPIEYSIKAVNKSTDGNNWFQLIGRCKTDINNCAKNDTDFWAFAGVPKNETGIRFFAKFPGAEVIEYIQKVAE